MKAISFFVLTAIAAPAFSGEGSYKPLTRYSFAPLITSQTFTNSGDAASWCVSQKDQWGNNYWWTPPSTCHRNAGWGSADLVGWPYCPSPSYLYIDNLCHYHYPTPQPANSGKPQGRNSCDTSTFAADPINYTTGNTFLEISDWQNNHLSFTRRYNSLGGTISGLGPNWLHEYDKSITVSADGKIANVLRSDGALLTFNSGAQGWAGSSNITDTLISKKNELGQITGWIYQLSSDGSSETYSATGKLLQVQHANGQVINLSYDSAGLNLINIADSWGNAIKLAYDSNNHIASMADPAGNVIKYAYDDNNNLVLVTYADGKSVQYLYQHALYANLLTGIVDENGTNYVSWAYDDVGRATSNALAGGVASYTLTYSSSTNTSVKDPLNATRSYNFVTVNGRNLPTGTNQPSGSGCASSNSSVSYDNQANIISKIDFNGNKTVYQYDLARNLETQRVEAYGTPQARTISTQWHPSLALPLKIASPQKLELYTYDNGGNLLTYVVQPTSDSDGSSGLNVLGVGAGRTWAYSYNNYGQILSMTDPIGSKSQYEYDNKGNLSQITNAMGQITTLDRYDADGRVGRVISPAGITISYSYDLRGRLVEMDFYAASNQSDTQSKTLYRYDGVGNLTQITLADGSVLSYQYDPAHRLTGVTDAQGNKISYTLDNAGNRTQVKVTDPSGNLARQQNRAYDQLGRLQQIIGMSGQSYTYQYDANGNLTQIGDALNRVTTNQYDPLNRLIKKIDPLGGVSQYGYDLLDQLTSVTDPRKLTTNYTLDGLGNRTEVNSPDSGNSSYVYDAAGRMIQMTDARKVTATYQYDALNRLTTITYPDQTISYAWDNKLPGYLSQISDESGTIVYDYDAKGSVKQLTQTIPASGGITYPGLNVQYSYNSAGQALQQLLPSGQKLSYKYQNGVVTEIDLGDKPLVSNIAYFPLGGVRSYQYNGSQVFVRTQDSDGRVNSITSPVMNKVQSYDTVDRLTQVSDALSSYRTQNYSYDKLDHLQVHTLGASSWSYQYDINGNRTQTTTNGNTVALQIEGSSNRLQLVGSQQYSYLANGSQSNDGSRSDTYNGAGRLSKTVQGGATTYLYSASGQRMVKNSTRYVYDQWGHLLGEYSLTGQPQMEYVWLGDEVVSVLKY